jgi:lipid II:glycine glycyltransferase (peptidoglycan interpeptide bridge formation enzyme)
MIQPIKDKIAWKATLSKIGNYDFYHTYDYHKISSKYNETPVLLVYSNDENAIVALPILIRKIDNTIYYDATSVYGYVGPLTNNIHEVNLVDFQNKIQEYLASENIISVFSRLHPYIENQKKIIQSLGKITSLGKVVKIDLKIDEENQLKQYSMTTKRYLKKTQKQCSITVLNNEFAINKFIELYEENMQRVNAKRDYYFSKEYFLNFSTATDFKTEFVFVRLNDSKKIIAGAMIIYTNNIIQYHLSGTLNDYLKLTPIRLIIDTIRVKGKKEGYSIFNLGGGLGSKEDSLFNFKASFSKAFQDFETWNYISNKKIYDSLVDANTTVKSKKNKISYFPLYRYNE